MEMETDMADDLVNIKGCCRLCLSVRIDSLKSIFDPTLSPNRLPQKIQQLIQIQVSQNDRISIMVCNDCIIRLDTWFSYKKQCHRNQTKLAEWLNKASGQTVLHENILIKSEPLDFDTSRLGLLPVKSEFPNYNDAVDEEFGEFPNRQDTNEHLYSGDVQNPEETEENSVKCSDCGKVFSSANVRKRHQNAAHRRDKRAQMMEIKKPESTNEKSESELQLNPTDESRSGTLLENPSLDNTTTSNADNIQPATSEENTENNAVVPSENTSSSTDPTDTPKEDSKLTWQETSVEEKKVNGNDEGDNPIDKQITTDPGSSQTDDKNLSETVDQSNGENFKKAIEDQPNSESEQQKIQFAAGLKLLQKDTTPIECETLTKIENCYIEKCKAMVSMFHTLQCACHEVQHKTLKHLVSHLREMRIWFPLFTCYSCMISFTDRSTFTRHRTKCPKTQLETLIKLSNLRKRSEIKTRLYQNYKCNRCKFLYSFHEDFCKHINEDHAGGDPPFYCSCRQIFDSPEEYKTHCYTSCILSYYCDICFITTNTTEAFIKHCQETHDNSEGFLLRQDDSYTPRNHYFRHKEADDESNVIEGKRERRKSVREPLLVAVSETEYQDRPQDIPTKVLRKMIMQDDGPTTSAEWKNRPASCPLCKKEYCNVNNMVRHYRTHLERKEVEIPVISNKTGEEDEDFYSCPECGGVFSPIDWTKHLEENHPPLNCNECDKVFQFQSELDNHRSVHLNLKVYRDSKTHSYKTAAVSPGSETNGMVGVMVMCEICDSMFESKEELKQHKLTHHDSNMSSASSFIEAYEEEPSDLLQASMEIDEVENSTDSSKADLSVSDKIPCGSCGKLYSSVKSLKEHMMNKHGVEYVAKSGYPKKCQYCDKVCATGAGLAIHTQTHERERKSDFPKKCEYCDKVFTTNSGLYHHTQMHERMTLGDLEKEDPSLNEEVSVRERKDSTLESPEDESYHTCKRCFKVFGTKFKLTKHMKCHGIIPKKNRKILCDLCHVAVSSNAELEKHKAEEHYDDLDGMPTLQNEVDESKEIHSPLVYTDKETHNKPVIPKTKSSLVYCKYCKIAFNLVSDLTKHMHVEHGETSKPKITKEKHNQIDKPFKCPLCSKGFISMAAMTAHFGWHKRSGTNLEMTSNTLQGTLALKMAKRNKAVKKITAAASNKQEAIQPPEFQCSTCLMELPNDTALQIHILEKHRSLDARMLIPRCHPCNQDFVSQEEYETHKRFHDFLVRQKNHDRQRQMQTPVIQSVQSVSETPPNSPKKFYCNWCSSVFSRSDTLNAHIRNYHKEHVKTEFRCLHCDRVFEKQSSLTIHMKVHEKKAAATAGQSTIVASGKIYSCSICSQTFNFPKDLRMHTINAHPF